MKIKELIPSEEIIGGNLGIEVGDSQSDYRRVTENSLLFVLPGVSFDTYSLSEKYIHAKPRAIVTERAECFAKSKIPIITVRSARRAYAFAEYASSGLEPFGMKLIGVTGTNGKTSTATMLRHILTLKGERVGFIGTGKIEFEGEILHPKNYSMTTPDPDLLYPSLAQMQRCGATAVVMEVSSHALALEKLAPLKFDVGIFTGLSHEHLDFHKSMENYLGAKERLITNAKKGILNLDDASGRGLMEKHREKCIGIGAIYDADLRAREIVNQGFSGTEYIIRAKEYMTKVRLPIPGIYNVYNSLLAFAAARELGISPKEIKDAIATLPSIEGRYEIIRDGALTIIIDYAHTPLALESLLKSVNTNKNIRQNMIVVFGCGGERDKDKRPLMASVAKKYANKVIVTTDNPRKESPEAIVADIVKGFGGGGYGVILDRTEAIRYVISRASRDDIIVIAGKGHERYVADADGYRDFDEREIVKQALNERKREQN